MTTLAVHAIDPDRLRDIRTQRRDERGNPLSPFPAQGWAPLRCCLTYPAAGEQIALIAYSPFGTASAWSETGPVYVHPGPCAGYRAGTDLPDGMRTGPKVLRTYRADGTLDYDHIVLVPDGADLAQPLRDLLAIGEVATVHVRAVQTQCFAYAVTRPHHFPEGNRPEEGLRSRA